MTPGSDATPDLMRLDAEELAAVVPPVLVRAERLAKSVLLGAHGRRQTGAGDTFWQFRPATPTDEARRIDWRKSARGDQAFVQEKEWQVARNAVIWVDQSQSMQFSSLARSKADRAEVLGLALAILLLRAGERAGLAGPKPVPPARGAAQAGRIAQALDFTVNDDYGVPPEIELDAGAIVLVSDFLGYLHRIEAALGKLADRGRRVVMLQVIDPQEIHFPFDGRTVFESMTGALRYEVDQASALRERYLARLEARQAWLRDFARARGWAFGRHVTDHSPTNALLWLRNAVEGQA